MKECKLYFESGAGKIFANRHKDSGDIVFMSPFEAIRFLADNGSVAITMMPHAHVLDMNSQHVEALFPYMSSHMSQAGPITSSHSIRQTPEGIEERVICFDEDAFWFEWKAIPRRSRLK